MLSWVYDGVYPVYLKESHVKGESHYILCESYKDEDCWRFRQLIDLGPDPARHIVYPGGNSFYIDESIEKDLLEKEVFFCGDEIEELFMPFIDPGIRRIVERFQRPVKKELRFHQLGRDDLMKEQKGLHSFDKRRLHYLRCGRVDIGNLDARPWKFLNMLLDKSRDELEHILEVMEKELPPDEIRDYLYTALHMQSHFSHLLIRNQPAFLDTVNFDQYLLNDLCLLNRDEAFFKGVESHDPDYLHPYLIKYLILYFDNAFDPQNLRSEYIEDFVWKHRFYKAPNTSRETSMPEKEACRCLGISVGVFKKMGCNELLRCYRKRAKETHPDRGGDEETFIEIKNAYECLLSLKKG